MKVIWWELFLRRFGLKKVVRRTRSRRLQRIARAYHDMAVEMGGVLIKVGQFLSARADMLPEEITAELSGLQDEVPPEDFAGIRQLAEAELGGPLSERYNEFEEEPMAAASLGQVHRAKIAGNDDGWVDVVVKIQRPDIETIIAVDLAALRTVGRWLMRYKPIRRRADVPALLAEFSRILYEEIDYLGIAALMIRDGNYTRAASALSNVDANHLETDPSRYHTLSGLVDYQAADFASAAEHFELSILNGQFNMIQIGPSVNGAHSGVAGYRVLNIK